MYQVLKVLKQSGHKVTLLMGSGNPDPAQSHPLRAVCSDVQTYLPPSRGRLASALVSILDPRPYPASRFVSKDLVERTKRLLCEGDFDLAWVNFSFVLEALPQAALGGIPVVVDQQESERLFWQTYIVHGQPHEKIFGLINYRKATKMLHRVAGRADAFLCVSQIEANDLRRIDRDGFNTMLAPNGVDTEYFRPGSSIDGAPPSVMICASMAVQRNARAALWFCDRIWPDVRCQVPEAEFWIVGSNPGPKIQALNQVSGVRVTGTVDDVREYYKRATLVVAPYQFGAGTKLKVLEALAMGLPMVTTPNGCQGLQVTPGREVLVANDELSFIGAVVQLLRDRRRAGRMGRAARELAVRRYSWGSVMKDVVARLPRPAGRPAGAGHRTRAK